MKNKKTAKIVALTLAAVCTVSSLSVGLAACGKKKYSGPATDISGEITIMMWSGDGSFIQDLGHQNYAAEDLLGQNQAAAYAVAKEFNKTYPNVKINIYAKSGGPDDDGVSWAQYRENFRMEYGFYPDMYAATDLPGDAEKGLVADLSVFADDPTYQSFNKSIMSMMNIEGRQFGLPQYMVPYFVFVNKSLAEANNLDVPSPKWTIKEYTEFTSNSKKNEYYGAMDPEFSFIKTGTKDFTYNLLNRKDGDPYVKLNDEPTKKLLEYIPKWSNNAIWPQRDLGAVSDEFMESGSSWGFGFFKAGKLLTYAGEPWLMGDAAHPNPEHWGYVQASDWDLYPRPSTDYVGNHLGLTLDPWAIRNFAMDDGNSELSDDEYKKLQLTWEFAKFWAGDTRSWQARASQMWNDGGSIKTCLNDSFPLVTGEEFNKQMEIWYAPETHQRYKDKAKMPGFAYVLELWEKGEFWDASDKCYPSRYEFEGSSRSITYEWDNAWNPDVTGAARTDANWLDQIYAKLPDWNAQFNTRYTEAVSKLKTSLDKYYPVKK